MLKSLLQFLLARLWRAPAAGGAHPESGDNESVHLRRGQEFRRSGRAGEAIVHLRRAYALTPQAPGVLREFVTALIEFDMCDKALSIAAAAVARAPASYEAMYCLGFAHQKLHDPQRALSCYESASPPSLTLYRVLV